MMIRTVFLASVLAACALPCAAQDAHRPARAAAVLAAADTARGVEACSDTAFTGNTGMAREAMAHAQDERWPEPNDREDYRLMMLSERLGSFQRESGKRPRSLQEFAPPVAEVPWLSTCDPWGHRVRFTPTTGDEFELRSAGADGVFGTADDRVQGGLLQHEPRASADTHPGAVKR